MSTRRWLVAWSTANQCQAGTLLPRLGYPASGAFSLVELVVVLATLCLLVATLGPTLAKSALSAKAFQCMENNRRLCAAWRLYADDSQDRIVYSGDDGTGSANPQNQYAWTWSHLDFNPNDRSNWDTNADLVLRVLWPYTGRDAATYRCPSDPLSFLISGVSRPRVRDFSMNVFLGGYAGTDGGWGPQITNYRLFLKTTQLTLPGPANTFVFTDERPDCINWGNYFTDMDGYPNQPSLYTFEQDFPGMFHNLGGSFSFCDGHAEIHRWVDPRTTPPFPLVQLFPASVPVPNSRDVAWLQAHSTTLR